MTLKIEEFYYFCFYHLFMYVSYRKKYLSKHFCDINEQICCLGTLKLMLNYNFLFQWLFYIKMAGKRKVPTKTAEKKTTKTVTEKEKPDLLKKPSEFNECV